MPRRTLLIAILALALATLFATYQLIDPSHAETADPTDKVQAGKHVVLPRNEDDKSDSRTELADPIVNAEAATDSDESHLYGRLRIRATWQSDGSPAAGARVVFWVILQHNGKQRHLSLDEKGELLIDDLVPGIYRAMHDLYSFDCFPIEADKQWELEWSLLASPGIHGRVLLANGLPAAGAIVDCVDDANRASGTTQADENGHFELCQLPVNVTLNARLGVHFAEPKYVSLLNPGERRKVDLKLSHERVSIDPTLAGQVEVRVLDRNGAAVIGASVELWIKQAQLEVPGNRDRGKASNETTDTNGAIRFEGVAPGTITVTASAPKYATTNLEVILLPGGVAEARLTLPPGAVLEGSVTDDKGRAIPGVSVTIAKDKKHALASGLTDVRGHYCISELPAGTYQLRAECQSIGTAKSTQELSAGEVSKWSPTLDPGPTITGRVIDSTGQPLSDWHVRGLGSRGWCDADFTDQHGRFRLTRCVNPPYTVRVSSQAGLFVIPAAIEKGVQPGDDPLTLIVPPGQAPTAYLSGTILRPDGQAPASMKVRIIETASGASFIYPVDAKSGRFQIGPIPPATYSLQVQSRDKAWVESELGLFKLAANERKDIGLRSLVQPADIKILVHRQGVAGPVHGVVYSRSGSQWITQSKGKPSESETYTMELWSALGPDDYYLALSGLHCVSTSIPFSILPDQMNRVDVRLTEGAAFVLHVEGAPEDRSECIVTIHDADDKLSTQFMAWLSAHQHAGTLQLEEWRLQDPYSSQGQAHS